jgi:hypothetical protein
VAVMTDEAIHKSPSSGRAGTATKSAQVAHRERPIENDFLNG